MAFGVFAESLNQYLRIYLILLPFIVVQILFFIEYVDSKQEDKDEN